MINKSLIQVTNRNKFNFLQITDTDGCQDRVSRNKAKCFLKLLCSKDIILLVHLMLDVTSSLKTLSLMFQEKSACAADVHRSLVSAKAVLEKYKER